MVKAAFRWAAFRWAAFRWAAAALLLTAVTLVPASSASAAGPVSEECGDYLAAVTYGGYLHFGEHTSHTTRVPDTATRYSFYGIEGMRLRVAYDENTFRSPVGLVIYWVVDGNGPETICVTGTGEVSVPPLEHKGHYHVIVRPAAGETGTFAFTLLLDRG